MRLDVFLPVIRKPKPGDAPRRRSVFHRAARRVLPDALFSDPMTKRRGLARRALRTLGVSWLSSPVRRIVQGTCLVLFLLLFFHVCWPYSAQPPVVWRGWLPENADLDAGRFVISTDDDQSDAPPAGATVHLVDESAAAGAPEAAAIPIRILGRADGKLTIEPAESLSPDRLELLAFSLGPWTLHARDPAEWPAHYAENLAAKEKIAAETFLVIDPLVSLSTAIAARSWVWSLACAGIILAVCVLIPRGFCGYLCPLGTTIDLFDWAIGKRVTRFRVTGDGWWVHIKYYLLLGCLVAALCGVLFTGFVAAIPVITRGLLFVVSPFQTGSMRGWHQVPPLNIGHAISLALFFGVLGLGFLRPRFWCKYVCPSGAVFSLGNLFRMSERKVESSCINCNKCVEVCPFDAIKPDFTTRTTDCTLCQTCAGVCPTHAIKFVERWNLVELKVENDPPTHETAIGRRGFLAAGIGLTAGIAGGLSAGLATKAFGANLDDPDAFRPIRPPGSVPEREFLQMCIRCGECFQACPNDVLHPLGFQQGLEGLWTPHVVPDWSGCESSCNTCMQVCPTGAIRAIPIEEKQVCRIGLAIVDEQTCLPFAGREACQLCVDECDQAGYHAIEFTRVGTQADEFGNPIEGTGYVAPVVIAEKCVGCGLCQTRCYGINVKEKGLLTESAIVVVAGKGKEDRMMSGSYIELREREARHREEERRARESAMPSTSPDDSYLPDFLREPPP
ncbi:MAG: 4Fe-4S binding protein [Planctomycetaceae bacterium]